MVPRRILYSNQRDVTQTLRKGKQAFLYATYLLNLLNISIFK